MRPVALAALAFALLTAACNTGRSSPSEPQPDPAAKPVEAPAEASLRLGAPIAATAPKVALAEVAKQPGAYVGKSFATTGTVTAVCQHKGCWMELKDDASEAHVKMAGHAFFVPRDASGKRARVLAKLVQAEAEGSCGEGHADHGEGAGKGCKAEAEAQLGRPLAKLELVAEGVEIL